jgi:Tol biopolymer transport system component
MILKYRLVAVAFLTLALSLSCALVTRTFSPAPIPDSGAPLGLIVYSGIDGNIYTIDRTGKQKTAVTGDANADLGGGAEARVYQAPAWAPDGRRLAFIGVAGSSRANMQASLYTATAQGAERQNAFSSPTDLPFYLFWSPDSQHVSFLSGDSGTLALHLVGAGGQDHAVVSTGQPLYWDWAPDSKSLFLHVGGAAAESPSARLSLFTLNGAAKEKFLTLKPGFFQAPAWAPGGEELLLADSKDATQGELILAGRDGAVKKVLAPLKGPVAFAWAPDGHHLAYTTTTPGDTSGLFSHLLYLDPTQPEGGKEIVQDIVLCFFWSPDGRKIAYFVPQVQRPSGVAYPREPALASQRLLQTQRSLQSQRVEMQVEVYDLESGKTQHAAVVAPTDAFLQILPYFDQYQRSGTIWSPDSQDLVLSGLGSDGAPQIVVVDLAAGQSHTIAAGDLAFWSWK